MDAAKRKHIVEHLHGLAAGSLSVLAFFVAFSVPYALGLLARGTWSSASVTYPVLFLGLAWGAIREARRWQECRSAGGPI